MEVDELETMEGEMKDATRPEEPSSTTRLSRLISCNPKSHSVGRSSSGRWSHWWKNFASRSCVIDSSSSFDRGGSKWAAGGAAGG